MLHKQKWITIIVYGMMIKQCSDLKAQWDTTMGKGSEYMIFCVEDDDDIRELMIYTLKSAGFEAQGFTGGGSLFEALKTEKPQLIMLDIMLPGEDGIQILKRLRSNPAFADILIIMATAKGTEYDKVVGLDLGADDYLAKPFGMMEMVSRVKAALRRVKPKEETMLFQIGSLTMNSSEHTVYIGDKRIQLTLKEYELLKTFLENPGLVFTRDQLLQAVWGVEYVGETRTVDVHVNTLRTKLEYCGDYIKTVRGVGYRLEVEQ